jgi:hypothetical protein
VELKEAQIRLYEKRYRAAVQRRKLPSNLPSQRDILGKESKQPIEPPEKAEYWRDSCLYYAGKKVEQAIKDETDWDRNGYDWQGTTAHHMTRGTNLLIFSFPDRSARLVRIVDTQEIPTPEGRYFIAFKPLRGFRRRRFSSSFWRDLKTFGIVSSQADARDRRTRISTENWEQLKKMFRKT